MTIDVVPGENKGLECPKCRSTNTMVVKTRPGTNSKARLRRCNKCRHKWWTREEAVTSNHLSLYSA